MDICRQKGSRISRAACVAAFVCAGVVACWGTPSFGDITAYLQNDVRITGDQIHHYTDAGKTVTVVVGNFLLQVGPRQISGQDAVIWIDTSNHDRAVRHAITVYVEGDARVIEPGRLTRDKYLLVKLKVQGRISAKGGTLSTASLKDVPFYARAKKTRAEDAASLAAWREKIRSMGLRESSQAVAVRRSVGAKVDSPDEGDPARGDANDPKKAADVPPVPPRDPDKKPAAVRFRTPGGIRSKKDAEDPTRRITVATGKIYLAQGDADSDSFMEMQADRAVIFTRAGIADEKKDDMTDEQFIYKIRKRGFGPFRPQFWNLPDKVKIEIGKELESEFHFLFNKLNAQNTTQCVRESGTPHPIAPNLENEIHHG